MVDGKEDRPAVAKLQRYNAAAGLVRIMEEEPDGGEIVARKFVQSTSRIAQCTRALFKLSDYELDEFGYEAISPVSTSIAYRSLLAIVLERTTASSFFQIISTLMNDREGPAAILYLATTDRRTFFAQVDRQLIFKFSSTLVLIQEPLSRKWYCGVKLLCMLLMSPGHAEWESEVPLQLHLFNILRDLIHGVMENSPPGVSEASENHFIYRGLPVLPLIAACCRRIEEAHLPISSPSVPFKSFLELLIDFVRQQLVPRILKTERALAGLALMLLFQFPSVVELFSKIELSRFASLIMNMVLHPWTLRFQEADRFERDILRPLTAATSLGLKCLCSLPGSIFSGALSQVLNEWIVQLESPNENPYRALDLLEGLLWLSNKEATAAHSALIDGDACTYLTHALHYTWETNPGDRGIWRAKGLAMTCLGNAIEKMNREQLLNCIKKEMIASVVAIRDDPAVPLVQKGQAIFVLQRYTLAADRFGVQPFHRQDYETWDDRGRVRVRP